ncbi:hypothetical protein [Micromonospora gifhornensis]|uniref:hypothetical protein n=1 Tax=Micromonospora gifhornensis TaxID=84594 RepID=UPI00365BB232
MVIGAMYEGDALELNSQVMPAASDVAVRCATRAEVTTSGLCRQAERPARPVGGKGGDEVMPRKHFELVRAEPPWRMYRPLVMPAVSTYRCDRFAARYLAAWHALTDRGALVE